ncbi:hypothetical protein Bbelb_138920 [Branchiostoma belcheri]|nr:hypothetical protein Bbelb_138920 [Branchiostoma belcheri]
MKVVQLFLLFHTLLVLLQSHSTVAYPAGCSTSSTSANCDNQDLQAIPQDFPTSILTLYMRNNDLTNISHPAVSRFRAFFWMLSRLQTLRLDRNQLTSLPSGIFSQLSSLTSLYLNDNQLSTLSSSGFSGLNNLRYLYLQDNYIHAVAANAFNGLSQLITLILQNNNNITTGAFDGLPALQTLQVQDNQIKGNPWVCDCQILRTRFSMSGASFESTIICGIDVNPAGIAGQALRSLDPPSLRCEAPTVLSFTILNISSSISTGDNLTMYCETTGFPTPDLELLVPNGESIRPVRGSKKLLQP